MWLFNFVVRVQDVWNYAVLAVCKRSWISGANTDGPAMPSLEYLA